MTGTSPKVIYEVCHRPRSPLLLENVAVKIMGLQCPNHKQLIFQLICKRTTSLQQSAESGWNCNLWSINLWYQFHYPVGNIFLQFQRFGFIENKASEHGHQIGLASCPGHKVVPLLITSLTISGMILCFKHWQTFYNFIYGSRMTTAGHFSMMHWIIKLVVNPTIQKEANKVDTLYPNRFLICHNGIVMIGVKINNCISTDMYQLCPTHCQCSKSNEFNLILTAAAYIWSIWTWKVVDVK